MTKTPQRNQWLVPAAILGVAVAYLVFAFLPGRRAVKQLYDELETKQRPVATASTVVAALATCERELTETQAFTEDWNKRNAAKQGMASLFAEIHRLAKQAGVTPVRFEPHAAQAFETLQRGSLSLACTGTYPQMHDFLFRVESLPYALWVDSVQVKKSGEATESVLAEINLVVFTDN